MQLAAIGRFNQSNSFLQKSKGKQPMGKCYGTFQPARPGQVMVISTPEEKQRTITQSHITGSINNN